MHPPSSVPHFLGLSLWSSQTWVLSIPWVFFFFGQLFLNKPRPILFFFLPTGWSCNLFLAFYQKLKMISEIKHNMSRHILQGGKEDRIQWAGRPGPEAVCALACCGLSAHRGCGLCAMAVPTWVLPSVQWEYGSGCTVGGPSLLWLSQTHALYYVRNKTHSWR